MNRYDYGGLRLSRLGEPRFSHLLLLLGWVVYFAFYFLTENLIPPERCHLVHCALDDRIPFLEGFVVFYVGWYFLTAGSLLYFLLYDVPRFRQLQTFIIVTQAVAVAVYILWPSRQALRPAELPRENILTWIIGLIYAFDTPTGVCPSLHVAYSLGIASVWWKDRDAPRWWRLCVLALVLLICASTAFIKQHSMVDILAALPVGLLAEWFVFGRRRRPGTEKGAR